MGTMAWSEDTRCLYCEGRLPLYRKITHGQFCSSAHRKAYWEEQERLAVERLHQSHNSLNAYRSSAPEALVAAPELDPVQGAIPQLPAAAPAPLLEESPLELSEPGPYFWPSVRPCYACSLDFISAEPCEYEIQLHPLIPSWIWSAPEEKPFALCSRISVPKLIAPHPARAGAVGDPAAECEIAAALRHPSSCALSPGMRWATRLALPLGAGRGFGPLPIPNPCEPLALQAAPVTAIALKIAPQADVLLDLLDQQVPCPDSLLALSAFAAQSPSAPALPAAIDADLDVPNATFATATIPAAIPHYELATAGMKMFSAAISPVRGRLFEAAPMSGIPIGSDVPICYGSTEASAADFQVVPGGVLRLPPLPVAPSAGTFAGKPAGTVTADPFARASSEIMFPALAALAGSLAAASPAGELAGEIATAGLRRIPSDILKPAQGSLAPPSDSTVWDLTGGVSSDVMLPGLISNASAAALGSSGILALNFERAKPAAAAAQPVARLIPQTPEPHLLLPDSRLEPMDRKPPEDALRAKGSGLRSRISGEGFGKLAPAWAHASGFWQHAPRDLKLLLFAIPALLALVFHPGLPRVAYAAPQGGGFSGSLKRVLNDQFSVLRQTLENRAAIALDDDFRSGLDNWTSPGGSTTEWSFDSSGFVRPGPLAIYRPSVHLADYQTQFMGTIDKKALSWVVRAADFENFYVMKLVVVKPGPIPTIGLTRYAVIGGKAQDRRDINIPLNARADTLYSVRMIVQGSNFSVEVQGQMADNWTETRLPRGGVGFFTARGEESRVRWVQITHQYDMLGRLCAYLAPYDTTNGSWQP